MNYRKELGQSGEDSAIEHLVSNNFTILARNYRFGRTGEIDIIARKNELLIFVEVKRRNSGRFGGALYSISETKKKKIRTVAHHFLVSQPEHFSSAITCRFDMIAIENDSIEWIEDIFR